MITKKELTLSIFISIFSVIFLWWFWEKWFYAFWFNFTIISLLIISYFFLNIKNIKHFIKTNNYWIIPLILLILSFSIYENPYLKSINIFVIPVCFLLFFNYSRSKIEWDKSWNLKLSLNLLLKKIYIKKAVFALNQSINKWKQSQIIIKKIILWLMIFLWINTFIIILLMWADSKFAEIISNLFWYLNPEIILKTIFSIIIIVLLTAIKLSFDEELLIKNEATEKQIDPIISSIVLGWTIITYLIFIWVQIWSILANTLPIDFNQVVTLVKTWFWQLFFISIINLIFFFIYYKKTTLSIQKLLGIFVFASLIILFSAWNRMYMYVINYWFSYEKFTASYTVIYFWILFILMISLLIINKKIDILKISVILALWMYTLLNTIPMETIIFKTNLYLWSKTNTKMDKYQSHILSIDIYKSVNKIKWKQIYKNQDWNYWVIKRLNEEKEKKWYEKNIHNFY